MREGWRGDRIHTQGGGWVGGEGHCSGRRGGQGPQPCGPAALSAAGSWSGAAQRGLAWARHGAQSRAADASEPARLQPGPGRRRGWRATLADTRVRAGMRAACMLQPARRARAPPGVARVPSPGMGPASGANGGGAAGVTQGRLGQDRLPRACLGWGSHVQALLGWRVGSRSAPAAPPRLCAPAETSCGGCQRATATASHPARTGAMGAMPHARASPLAVGRIHMP
jgi:hypothetical protein